MQFFRALISHCNFFFVSATVWHSLQFSHSGWYTVGHDIAQDWITTVSKNFTPWWCSSCKENRRKVFAVLSPSWFAEGPPILCACFLLHLLLEKPWRNWAQQQQILILLLIHRSQSLLRLGKKWVMCKESSLPSGAVFLLRFLLKADGSVLLFLAKFPGPRKLTRQSRIKKREGKQNDLREKATFVVVADVCGLLFLFHSISQNSSQPAT